MQCEALFQIGICSVLGIPWFVAATVLSINHVRSLTVESESAAPGEKPRFLGIRCVTSGAGTGGKDRGGRG